MSVDEAPVILALIESIKADKSRTVILVEHKLDVVRSLPTGSSCSTRAAGRRRRSGRGHGSAIVREAYLGFAPDGSARHEPRRCSGSPASTRTSALITSSRASTSTCPRRADDAARSEWRRQDDGVADDDGTVARIGRARIPSKDERSPHSKRRHRAPGIGYVPETMGIFASLSVKENLTLAARGARSPSPPAG